MTAEIITIPVPFIVRIDSNVHITMEIRLQRAITNKLCAAASIADSSVESMAQALIVWGLATIEHMSPEEFYATLNDATLT